MSQTRLSQERQEFWWVVGLGVVLVLGLGLFSATRASLPVMAGQTRYSETLSVDEMTEVTQTSLLFNSKRLMGRTMTQVTVPWNDPTGKQIVWLNFDHLAKVGDMVFEHLVIHPQLNDLRWSSVSKGDIHLYQRTPVYSSVDEFLASPPDLSELAADAQIKDVYLELKPADRTDIEFDLQSKNFILTTFVPSESRPNGVRVFSKRIDTSAARVADDAVVWMLRAPFANSDLYYRIGNIQVEFLGAPQ